MFSVIEHDVGPPAAVQCFVDQDRRPVALRKEPPEIHAGCSDGIEKRLAWSVGDRMRSHLRAPGSEYQLVAFVTGLGPSSAKCRRHDSVCERADRDVVG